MEEPNAPQESIFGLNIDPNSRVHLTETAKWTRFLAIAGFIAIGLMILYGIIMSFTFQRFMPRYSEGFESPYSTSGLGYIFIVYTSIFGIIYFFPCLFTLRFSNFMKQALLANDQDKLTLAFQNLKITVRYLGILTIIALVLGVISLLFILAAGSLVTAR